MKDYKQQFDIFICGGSEHVPMLKTMLGKLQPFGKVHLGSCFLSEADLAQLRGLYDVLHTPRHSPDGYRNFELFSIRDINRLAAAPYFVKLDADIHVEPDWIDYVEECIAAHPDAVLFGARKGNNNINFEISGALVRQVLARDIRVENALKVIGGFYVGKTAFFKEHLRFFDIAHEFLWCFKDGVRHLPSINPEYWPPDEEASREPVTVVGRSENFQGNEDTLRSLVVHAVGAGDRLHVFDSRGRVQIHRANIANP
ncbi:MAG TPA: hypothetical protein VJT82_12945 [Pyrinomonadaceae bacterium]|nr:hypothetical protein [Pyrinomonadaceae bacterium]